MMIPILIYTRKTTIHTISKRTIINQVAPLVEIVLAHHDVVALPINDQSFWGWLWDTITWVVRYTFGTDLEVNEWANRTSRTISVPGTPPPTPPEPLRIIVNEGFQRNRNLLLPRSPASGLSSLSSSLGGSTRGTPVSTLSTPRSAFSGYSGSSAYNALTNGLVLGRGGGGGVSPASWSSFSVTTTPVNYTGFHGRLLAALGDYINNNPGSSYSGSPRDPVCMSPRHHSFFWAVCEQWWVPDLVKGQRCVWITYPQHSCPYPQHLTPYQIIGEWLSNSCRYEDSRKRAPRPPVDLEYERILSDYTKNQQRKRRTEFSELIKESKRVRKLLMREPELRLISLFYLIIKK